MKPQKKFPKNLHKSKPSANPSQTRGKHHNAKIQHSESAIHGFSLIFTSFSEEVTYLRPVSDLLTIPK